MRVDPPAKEKILKKNDPERLQAITRKVAIVVAVVSVYIFFFKLLFF